MENNPSMSEDKSVLPVEAGSEDISPRSNAENTRTARRLVTVRVIKGVRMLKEDRRFDVVEIDGWTVLAPKKEFKVGQLVVYFEIDCFIRATDGRFWEHVSNGAPILFNGQAGFRVKTRIIGKTISQGLILNLGMFPEINDVFRELIGEVGKDEALKDICSRSWEKALGMEKWMTEAQAAGTSLGAPPSFIVLPSCERAQNMMMLFESRLHNLVYQITEKLDGASMMIYKVAEGSVYDHSLGPRPNPCPTTMQAGNYRIGVCSRTDELIDSGSNLYWETAKESGILEKLHTIELDNLVICGELCGSSIEANSMGWPQGVHKFVVFDIWDIDRRCSLPPTMVEEICDEIDIPHVPILGYKRLCDFAENMDDLVAKAEGRGMNGQMREGLVFTSLDASEQFKVISNAWLIATGKTLALKIKSKQPLPV